MNASKEEAQKAIQTAKGLVEPAMTGRPSDVRGILREEFNKLFRFLDACKERLPSEAFYARDEENTNG